MTIEQTLGEILARLDRIEGAIGAPRAESINKHEAAVIFGVSTRTIDDYEDRGIITRQPWAAGVRYSRDDVIKAASRSAFPDSASGASPELPAGGVSDGVAGNA